MTPEPARAQDPLRDIARYLIDQFDEPFPGGSDSQRLHYWRNKAINASRLLAALTPPAAPEIPAGMVVWNGGDAPPADWDGGPVLRRSSKPFDDEPWKWSQVIAYTPTARPAATAGEVERVATVADYNAAFDPADEAFGGAFRAGFREGWIFAQSPDGTDYDELAEQYGRSVEIEPSEAWDGHRDEYFAMLPLYALPEIGKPLAALASDRGEIERLARALAEANEELSVTADERDLHKQDAATLREGVVTILGRCEALEDEAYDELEKVQTERAEGYLRGQKSTAKSIRNHLHDMTRSALSERPVPYQAETDRSDPAANPSADGAAEVVAPDAGEVKRLRLIAQAVKTRMATACDWTRAGKDHVKVRTADWHVLMEIAESARAAVEEKVK